MVDQLLRHMGCDRCGEAWTGPSTQQPPGWVGVAVLTTPLGSTDLSRNVHLCEDCGADLNRFLQNWAVSRRG